MHQARNLITSIRANPSWCPYRCRTELGMILGSLPRKFFLGGPSGTLTNTKLPLEFDLNDWRIADISFYDNWLYSISDTRIEAEIYRYPQGGDKSHQLLDLIGRPRSASTPAGSTSCSATTSWPRRPAAPSARATPTTTSCSSHGVRTAYGDRGRRRVRRLPGPDRRRAAGGARRPTASSSATACRRRCQMDALRASPTSSATRRPDDLDARRVGLRPRLGPRHERRRTSNAFLANRGRRPARHRPRPVRRRASGRRATGT